MTTQAISKADAWRLNICHGLTCCSGGRCPLAETCVKAKKGLLHSLICRKAHVAGAAGAASTISPNTTSAEAAGHHAYGEEGQTHQLSSVNCNESDVCPWIKLLLLKLFRSSLDSTGIAVRHAPGYLGQPMGLRQPEMAGVPNVIERQGPAGGAGEYCITGHQQYHHIEGKVFSGGQQSHGRHNEGQHTSVAGLSQHTSVAGLPALGPAGASSSRTGEQLPPLAKESQASMIGNHSTNIDFTNSGFTQRLQAAGASGHGHDLNTGHMYGFSESVFHDHDRLHKAQLQLGDPSKLILGNLPVDSGTLGRWLLQSFAAAILPSPFSETFTSNPESPSWSPLAKEMFNAGEGGFSSRRGQCLWLHMLHCPYSPDCNFTSVVDGDWNVGVTEETCPNILCHTAKTLLEHRLTCQDSTCQLCMWICLPSISGHNNYISASVGINQSASYVHASSAPGATSSYYPPLQQSPSQNVVGTSQWLSGNTHQNINKGRSAWSIDQDRAPPAPGPGLGQRASPGASYWLPAPLLFQVQPSSGQLPVTYRMIPSEQLPVLSGRLPVANLNEILPSEQMRPSEQFYFVKHHGTSPPNLSYLSEQLPPEKYSVEDTSEQLLQSEQIFPPRPRQLFLSKRSHLDAFKQ